MNLLKLNAIGHLSIGGYMKKRLIYALAVTVIILSFVYLIILFMSPEDIQSTDYETVKTASITSSNNLWLYITIFILSITTIISVIISFYLYKWRKILLSTPELLVPEEWGKCLNKVSNSVDQLNNDQTKIIQKIIETSQSNTEKLQNMIETYMILQKTLDEKDNEIKRLKKGYDTEIIKKFLYRFIKIDQSISGFIEDKDFGPESMDIVQRFLEDALAECGVEKFIPTVGDDVRNLDGISENSKKITTEIEEDNFKITEIISEGYRLTAGDKFHYIVPAKVKVAIYKDKEINK